MSSKVILILVDGMRPDGILECGHPYLSALRQKSSYSFSASTIMPSVTLPCHTSLFFSVNADRHGITTNTWMPPVRPIEGICEIVSKFGKKAAMVYNQEELRDLSRPGSLAFSHYERIPHDHQTALENEQIMTDLTLSYIKKENPDFLFLYLGYVDAAGHNFGWMTPNYFEAVANASSCIEKLVTSLPEGYEVIITADHGGHDRGHGADIPEDMTIPIIGHGPSFTEAHEFSSANIKDIAPTITHLLGLPNAPEWEGKCLI